MKKEYRLKRNEDFETIIKKRNNFVSKNFIIYIRKNELSHLRVGISVSKKLGNAVSRNKIKRQIRMMVQNVFQFDQKYDMIVIVRKDYLKSSYNENKKNLSFLYDKIQKRMGK